MCSVKLESEREKDLISVLLFTSRFTFIELNELILDTTFFKGTVTITISDVANELARCNK